LSKIKLIALLPLAFGTFAIGYVAGGFGRTIRGVRRLIRWDWRTVSYGPLRARVPQSWGEIETSPEGFLVLHNLPARLRVDGDAVWYGNAIELRIHRQGQSRPNIVEASRSWKRYLGSAEVPLVADLVVANGVRPAKEKEAREVLRSLHLVGDSTAIAWPAKVRVYDDRGWRRVLSPHQSNVARDFERF
jgi:hypothetical protein